MTCIFGALAVIRCPSLNAAMFISSFPKKGRVCVNSEITVDERESEL